MINTDRSHLFSLLLFFWTMISQCYLFIQSESADDFPTLWEKAPSSISDYPLANNCSFSSLSSSSNPRSGSFGKECRQIDPWVYLDRLGIYKILIEVTTPLMKYKTDSNQSNILFGLPAQFSWQYRSNRLLNNGSQMISTNSWWASANYYLSVIPFLAAADAGLIDEQQFQLKKQENFCSTIYECYQQIPQAMTEWKYFFANISEKNYCTVSHYDDRVIDRCYLHLMWRAHISSITFALPLIQSKLSFLPSINEQRFGIAWANLVDFIGKSRKNTNLTETNKYQQDFIPNRMLTDQDNPPNIPDLPAYVNNGLQILFFIHNDWYPTLKHLWKPATCNFEGRMDAQRVLETMAISISSAVEYYNGAVAKSLIHPCDNQD